MLDVRSHRRNDPEAGRTILGPDQLSIVTTLIRNSTAHWMCVASPVLFTPLAAPRTESSTASALKILKVASVDGPDRDGWAGFLNERSKLLSAMADSKATPFVVSGDSH